MSEEAVFKEILLKAKKQVYANKLGARLTPFKGKGLDFHEIKPYEMGDDIRHINWNASAKSNEVQTNVFHEERELNIVLAFMSSPSLNFGSQRLKQDVLAEVFALLGFSVLRNKDTLHTLFFADKALHVTKPSKNLGLVEEGLRFALGLNVLESKADYKAFSAYVQQHVKRKSLIFILGDFFQKPDLKNLAHKHEVYALCVRDALEEQPLLQKSFHFIDPLSKKFGEFFLSKGIARRFQKSLQAQDNALQEHFLHHGIGFGKIYTHEDVYTRLCEILKV